MSTRATVLTVDDDPTLLKLIGILLREEGFKVLAADSAEKALALLAVEKPDLVVTDLRMGGMDGLALFDAVRKSNPMLPVIILTAHGTIPDAVDATKRGVFGFVTKPYEARALLAEIDKALSGHVAAASLDHDETPIITRSQIMHSVLDEARLVAATDASVLISGDTGSGKELLAQTLHDWSHRREAPFIAVNCGAIPEHLMESELFGHVKGSFTGAVRDHRGLLQEAQGGTIFLDEIGDMPLPLQVKLLRVLQEREVRPVGAARSVAVDVRVVSATHRDLDAEIAAGRFREDLYYRVNVVNLKLPPLSERREDIPLLAGHFLAALGAKYKKTVNGFAGDAAEALLRAAWPGNVRQLFNVVEKCVALSTSPIVPLSLVERALSRPSEDMSSFDEARRAFERDYLLQLLKITAGNVTQAARVAKRNRSDFYTLLNRHQIDPALFKS
ncbi:MAG: sigma 54-interacting transcriptional regulator [Betaproteobacteria bacterium]|nr:sigma 54-interacting transcriptional regulator [Betaproteobacteria bacterium]